MEADPLAILPIVKYPDPILLSPCDPVISFDESLRILAEDMVETMHASAGVGLAANQVGRPIRLVVLDLSGGERDEDLIVACNPRIEDLEGDAVDEEGCLSLPGLTAAIQRPARLRALYQDLSGEDRVSEAEDLLARVWCHEMDHIDGRTILDRVSSLKRSLLKSQVRKMVRNGEWE